MSEVKLVLAREVCRDCKHEAHDPGQCAQDNCGESEICHRTPMSGLFLAKDPQGRPAYSTGTAQVFVAPTEWRGWRR